MESSFLSPVKVIRAAHLQPGAVVADFGSGSGFFARAAAREVGRQGVVWALDADRELLRRTQVLAVAEGLHNIEIVVGDAEQKNGSQLPEGAMDTVIASNILFSSQDKDALIEEIWRVLKPLGKTIVIDWKDSFGGLGPAESHIVPEAVARMLFERGGFTFVEKLPEIAVGSYHWGCVFRKKAD